MYLGKLKRNEAIPISLTLDTAPTGTPQYRILDASRNEIVAATNLSGSELVWYKTSQAVDASATVGSYLVEYSAVIDGVTRYACDSYEVTVNEIDDIKTDTETIITNIGAVSGAYSVIINVKDGSSNNLEGVNISVHNSANDDGTVYGIGSTDTNGNTVTFNLDPATYKVRLSKAGAIVSEVETMVITASGTINLTVTAQTVSNPTDLDVCRLRIYPITLDNADVTALVINISSDLLLTKIDGQFISNATMSFTYDSATSPDSYYFDAVRDAEVYIQCEKLGIDHVITVPDTVSQDLSGLIS